MEEIGFRIWLFHYVKFFTGQVVGFFFSFIMFFETWTSGLIVELARVGMLLLATEQKKVLEGTSHTHA